MDNNIQTSSPSAESAFSHLLNLGFELRAAQRIFPAVGSNPELCYQAVGLVRQGLEAVVRRRATGSDLTDPKVSRPANIVLNFVANSCLCELGDPGAQGEDGFSAQARTVLVTLQTLGIPFPEVTSTRALRQVMRGLWEATRYPLPESFLQR